MSLGDRIAGIQFYPSRSQDHKSRVFFICDAYYGIKYEDFELQTINLYYTRFDLQNFTRSEQDVFRYGVVLRELNEAISIAFFIYGE